MATSRWDRNGYARSSSSQNPFLIWNSEVGPRSIGIETFWFQQCCANHIVWDAVEVVRFSRKHTASTHESLAEVRRILKQLVQRRDARRSGFSAVVDKAVSAKLEVDTEKVKKLLAKQGISRTLIRKALSAAVKLSSPKRGQ